MFSHFGLRDVLFGVWKRKYWMLLLLVIAIILAGIQTAIQTMGRDKAPVKAYYANTLSIYVEAEPAPGTADSFDQSQKVRNAYLAAFQSEYFAQYLTAQMEGTGFYDSLRPELQESQPERAGSAVEEYRRIQQAIRVTGPEDTCNLELSVFTSDEQTGRRLLDAAVSFAKQELKGKINPSTVEEVGRNTVYDPGETKPASVKDTLINFAKQAAIIAIGLEALYLILLFFVMLFRPTLNRKSDLDEYSAGPVWEL